MVSQIYGLVLSGGKSLRMGQDKGQIDWYGKSQKYYLADSLAANCDKVFISCRPDQADQIDAKYLTIIDKEGFTDSYGAIMSALSECPDVAWLVAACDMPFIDKPSIENLICQRNPAKIATAYFNPDNNLPEPLFAIWEPKSLPVLQKLAKQGVNCPRKALIKCGQAVKLIEPLDKRSITNVNTPEEAKNARRIIDGQR